jgi:SAM-dependent methyltransferase
MPIGATVRHLLGPLEQPVSELYRRFFVDLDMQLGQLKSWVPEARNILEIGCGEGAIAQRLTMLYPSARITGIDISPRVGRLFSGLPGRVTFSCETAAEHARSHGGHYDLVLTCDVLHHVPWDQHPALLAQARSLLVPGGTFVLKDWEKIYNIGHAFCAFSDRVLTGDRVRFGKEAYFRKLLEASFGSGSVKACARIRPWPNNMIFHCRPEAA